MRTAMLADKLLERGHSVYWWASAFEHQRKMWISDESKAFRLSENFTIHVLKGCGYKTNISIRRYIDHLIIARKFRHRIQNSEPPDLIIASTPCYHMAYEGFRYANRNKTPIVVDIRDLWPDIFLAPNWNSIFKLGLQMALRKDFKKVSTFLRNADALTAMSQGCLDWGLKKVGRTQSAKDRVFYLGYKRNRNENLSKRRDFSSPAKKMFLFIGTFGNSYELELILEAAKRFQDDGRRAVCFTLAGTGQQYQEIKERAAKLKNVTLPGWLEEPALNQLLAAAWAGIVPCKSVIDAAPNKVFEYLSAGLPLISSLEGEVAEMIDRHMIGINYRSGDAEDLFNAINKLASQAALREKMSANSHVFFKDHGDAENIYSDFADYIGNFVI